MVMPHRQMSAFVRAGQLLSDLVDTKERLDTWDEQLPKCRVSAAETAHSHHPQRHELECAAVEQRRARMWMSAEVWTTEQKNKAYERLTARSCAEMNSEDMAFECIAHLNEWLFTEHPALGYRESSDVLDIATGRETIARLFNAEHSISREARGVSRSKAGTIDRCEVTVLRSEVSLASDGGPSLVGIAHGMQGRDLARGVS